MKSDLVVKECNQVLAGALIATIYEKRTYFLITTSHFDTFSEKNEKLYNKNHKQFS